jgi:hypothetical protein
MFHLASSCRNTLFVNATTTFDPTQHIHLTWTNPNVISWKYIGFLPPVITRNISTKALVKESIHSFRNKHSNNLSDYKLALKVIKKHQYNTNLPTKLVFPKFNNFTSLGPSRFIIYFYPQPILFYHVNFKSIVQIISSVISINLFSCSLPHN